jgi:NAD-dependent SIR2 family protein deacetylase
MAQPTENASTPEDRSILLSPGTAPIPECLLLAHGQGKVLFVAGAGVSRAKPSRLPDFRGLVLDLYERLDPETHEVMSALPPDACNRGSQRAADLSTAGKHAEVNAFLRREYDVVLGMLERRIDGPRTTTTRVRTELARILRTIPAASGSMAPPEPNSIHHALLRLSNRGAATAIVTTNFDRLFEDAARKLKLALRTHTLGAIPRPSERKDFSGVLHIHGALSRDETETDDFVLTDQDFGEFYLRRRVVADFMYDAARIFHLVLVGYSANDPPMRYLLNAIAADQHRFPDLKPIHVFFGMNMPPDPVQLAEWKGRNLNVIPYDSQNEHAQLARTLERWAELSPITRNRAALDKLLDRLLKPWVSRPCDLASHDEVELFKHLVRRSGPQERRNLAGQLSRLKAHFGWLDAMLSVEREAARSV